MKRQAVFKSLYTNRADAVAGQIYLAMAEPNRLPISRLLEESGFEVGQTQQQGPLKAELWRHPERGAAVLAMHFESPTEKSNFQVGDDPRLRNCSSHFYFLESPQPLPDMGLPLAHPGEAYAALGEVLDALEPCSQAVIRDSKAGPVTVKVKGRPELQGKFLCGPVLEQLLVNR